MRFQDKVVLITGASRWIGRATSLFFAKEWATVIVNYFQSEESAKKVLESIEKIWGKGMIIRADVSEEIEVKNMIEAIISSYGKIDILVNNAGISSDVPFFDRTAEQWKKTMDVNLLGTFLCSKYALKEMQKLESGVIINTASINGTKHFYPEQVDYDTSKAGIISLTQNLAKIAGKGVRVNAIAPWNIDNVDESCPTGEPTEEDKKKVYLERHGKISEIAKATLFLADSSSSFINGTIIYIDGGCNNNP